MIINFDDTPVNYAEILERVSEKEIYEYYLREDIQEGKPYCCPFHKDSTPSMWFKLMPSSVLIFNCFGCGMKGSVFNFVSKLLNLSPRDTIKQINRDLNLTTGGPVSSTRVAKKESIGFSNTSNIAIFPVFQNYNIVDFNYWGSYNIPLSLLKAYDVQSCKQVYIKTRENKLVLFAEYSKSNPIYCYTIDSSHKIYRPLNPTKNGKWLNTTKLEDIQGMKQLPSLGKLLIITSSMKDLLVLKVLGYDAIALGGEGNRIPAKILDYLYACFDEILVFYDNDEAGINYGRKFASEIGSDYIYIPEKYSDTKDISDFIKKYGINQTRCLLTELINGRRREEREGKDISSAQEA